jgi:hypothetical protein
VMDIKYEARLSVWAVVWRYFFINSGLDTNPTTELIDLTHYMI